VSNDTQYQENNEVKPQVGGAKDKEFQFKQNIHKSPYMANPYKKEFPVGDTEKLRAKDPERFHTYQAPRTEFIKPSPQTEQKDIAPKQQQQQPGLIKPSPQIEPKEQIQKQIPFVFFFLWTNLNMSSKTVQHRRH
jgi:hypothetical protein